MNIKVIKLVTGEEIVAEVVSADSDNLVVSNPLILMLQQRQDGQGLTNVVLPWATGVEGNIALSQDKVIFTADPKSDLADQYKNLFGSVVTPSTPKLVIKG